MVWKAGSNGRPSVLTALVAALAGAGGGVAAAGDADMLEAVVLE